MIKRRFVVGQEYHFVGLERDNGIDVEFDSFYLEQKEKSPLKRVVIKKFVCDSIHQVKVDRGTALIDGFIFFDQNHGVQVGSQYPKAQYRQDSIYEDFVVRSGKRGFTGIKIDTLFSELERKKESMSSLSDEEQMIYEGIRGYMLAEGLHFIPSLEAELHPEQVRSYRIVNKI